MQQWWWPIISLAVAGAGYVIRRLFERRRRSEALKRKLQALGLHIGMRREGLTLEDLDRLEHKAGN